MSAVSTVGPCVLKTSVKGLSRLSFSRKIGLKLYVHQQSEATLYNEAFFFFLVFRKKIQKQRNKNLPAMYIRRKI